MVMSIFNFFLSLMESPLFLFGIITLSFLIKVYFLKILIPHGLRTSSKPCFFLIGILIGSLFDHSAWLALLGRKLWFPDTSYLFVTFIIRLAWAFLALHYQALCLFIESLTKKNYTIPLFHKILLGFNSSFALYFLGTAFFDQRLTDETTRYMAFQAIDKPLEFIMMRIANVYTIILCAIVLVVVIKKIRKDRYLLPRLLKRQLTIVMYYFMLPYILIESFQAALRVSDLHSLNNLYISVNLSTLFLTCAIFYCATKVMGLRFLNVKEHVTSPHKFNFINDFNAVLEQLSHATTFKELEQITQLFFKEAFKIPLNKTELQPLAPVTAHNATPQRIYIESFMMSSNSANYEFVRKSKILIYDEISFSNFYLESEASKNAVIFLDGINTDIFIPIYEKQTMIAYIKIERNARTKDEFYSDVERDEMLVFASYLENIISLLQHRNLNNLIQQEKDLRDELYKKHQEINQYKESFHAALRATKSNDVGIIFYKGGRFTFGNHRAKEFISSANTNYSNSNGTNAHDDSVSSALKTLAQQVEEYKTPQVTSFKDAYGNRLIASALPNIDQQGVIITVRHEEVLNTIKEQIDILNDPSKWDYLLYLETTQSGKLIHKLLPGSGETLLNFKIALLKIALSKKAILLEIPEDDLIPTVELLHHISLRENLHILTLNGHPKGFDMAIKLFGINPIFGLNEGEPILKKLDRIGTLFIQNIHLLDLDTQQYLAEYIKTGFYRIFKTDRKISSDVRIICSTNQNLQQLVQVGKFSKALFQELKATSLHLPSLVALPEPELHDLAQGLTEQLQHPADQNEIILTEQEKNALVHNRPTSLSELKNRLKELIDNKENPQVYHEITQLDPELNVTEPELIKAAQLGKHALKDPKIMALLWNKFQNQNKIATFLGVNRSSVNRRCKEYNIL